VAEVLEARKRVGSYQLAGWAEKRIIYMVAEALEAHLIFAIHHLRNHINLINHSSDNLVG
jgi:hypothetical protein